MGEYTKNRTFGMEGSKNKQKIRPPFMDEPYVKTLWIFLALDQKMILNTLSIFTFQVLVFVKI